MDFNSNTTRSMKDMSDEELVDILRLNIPKLIQAKKLEKGNQAKEQETVEKGTQEHDKTHKGKMPAPVTNDEDVNDLIREGCESTMEKNQQQQSSTDSDGSRPPLGIAHSSLPLRLATDISSSPNRPRTVLTNDGAPLPIPNMNFMTNVSIWLEATGFYDEPFRHQVLGQYNDVVAANDSIDAIQTEVRKIDDQKREMERKLEKTVKNRSKMQRDLKDSQESIQDRLSGKKRAPVDAERENPPAKRMPRTENIKNGDSSKTGPTRVRPERNRPGDLIEHDRPHRSQRNSLESPNRYADRSRDPESYRRSMRELEIRPLPRYGDARRRSHSPRPHNPHSRYAGRPRLRYQGTTAFFIMKSFVEGGYHAARNEAIWVTTRSNEGKLIKAYKDVDNVVLIFTIHKSGGFQGYARLTTLPGDTPLPSWYSKLNWHDSKAMGLDWGINDRHLKFEEMPERLLFAITGGNNVHNIPDGLEIRDEVGHALVAEIETAPMNLRRVREVLKKEY